MGLPWLEFQIVEETFAGLVFPRINALLGWEWKVISEKLLLIFMTVSSNL